VSVHGPRYCLEHMFDWLPTKRGLAWT
jgi:hypothetical protein